MLPPVGFLVALVLVLAGWLAIGPWSLAVALVAVLVPATRRRIRPSRWTLGGVVALVAVAVGAVVLVPDGRLPLPPGGGLLVTPSYDGRGGRAAADRAGGAAAPGAGAERAQLDARGRVGDGQLRVGGAARGGPGGHDRVVRPGGVRDARVRPGGPAGRAVRQPAGPGHARARPGDDAAAVDVRPAGPRAVGQAAVGGPVRRCVLLPRRRRAGGGGDDRPADPHVEQRRAGAGGRGRPRPAWCRTTTAWSRCCRTGRAPPGTSPRTVASARRAAASRWTSAPRSPTRSRPTTPASTW